MPEAFGPEKVSESWSSPTTPPPGLSSQGHVAVSVQPSRVAAQGVVSEVVTDIAAAVARLEQGGIEAVFCDLRMPGGGGGALYRHAVAVHPRLRGRFCFVTGDTVAGPSAIAALDPDHPPPMLEKPFGPAEIAAALAAISPPGL